MIFGIVYQIKNFLYPFCGKFLRFLMDFIFCLIGGMVFWYSLMMSNLGEVRIFLLICFLFGFTILQFCLKKFFSNMGEKLYNCINEKIINKTQNNKKIN